MNLTDDGRTGSNGVAQGAEPGSDARLAEALAEYRGLLEAGSAPDRAAFLSRHPEIAAELAECLSGLEFVHAVAPALSGAAAEGAAAGDAGAGVGPGAPLGDFRIIREVGRGGMGIVYEAEQVSLGRRVALKVLPFAATMDPRQLQRFHNEARAAASLHHEHIVPVHAVGMERGVHYYAMQFIDGQGLDQLIAQRRGGTASEAHDQPTTADDQPTPTPATVAVAAQATSRAQGDAAHYRHTAELIAQAADALEHAHALGVVHRDVKPANLMLDAHGKLWVTDFGLARLGADAGLTMTGDLLGTLRYMSPEQALAKHGLVDHRTDVYALGATLYELLTLRPAVDGKDREEILHHIAFDEPRPPRALDRSIPTDLETITLKALANAPSERYATAKELADDLRRFLGDQPIRAKRPSLRQRAGKWARRHKPLVGAVAAVLVLAVTMLASSVGWEAHDWSSRHRETERVVAAAMDEADGWQVRGRLPEALSAARRAAGLVRGGTADEALKRKAESRLADLELVERLENARLEGSSAVKDNHFDDERADASYKEIFRGVDIDVDALPAEEASRRIQRTTVAVEIAAALDAWAMIRRYDRRLQNPSSSWRYLLQVAREADPNEGRGRVRAALEREQQQREALVALATSDEAKRLLPATMYALAMALVSCDAAEQAESLLREVRQRRPDDFWANELLASLLRHKQPPQLDEATRYHAVAVALRPQSPGARLNLGIALRAKGDMDGAIAEFREAIRIKEDYADAHNSLGPELYDKGDVDGAVAECREAIRLKKDNAYAHNNLGIALQEKGDVSGAIDECREAIRLKPDYTEAHNNLGNLLSTKGDVDGAIAEHREAIRLKKDNAYAHNNLGSALQKKGDVSGAIDECREAIRLKPDYTEAHYNLGNALQDKGDVSGAIDEYRAAIRLKKDYAYAHNNLGTVLGAKGDVDGAIAEFREAIRIKEDCADAHNNLGVALRDKGDLDGAIAEHREDIRLKKDNAEAHCNLGHELRDKGHFVEALAHLRQGHELGSKNPRWRNPSAQWVKECERLVELDGKLPWILVGEAGVADARECVDLAVICTTPAKQLYAAAVGFYAESLAAEPQLNGDQPSEPRYNAACAAALAGCGRGKDTAGLQDEERAALRLRALSWLRADLAAWRQLLEKQPDQTRPAVAGQMSHWLADTDFAGVRGPEALAKLPEAERQSWQKLWAEVEQLRTRAGGEVPGKKK